MAFDYYQYLRTENLPHIWCPGCGHGIVLKALLRAIDRLKLSKDELCLVSGIGCASRLPGYVDVNTLHTTHGRAIPFATGLKLVKPDLKVIITSGDGDAVAIGGNHFIHGCRRNLDITLIIFNNLIYGMTGGQQSPTTPMNRMSTTTPLGNPNDPFDFAELAKAAGATFVARSTTYHVRLLDRVIQQAIEHKGFSVVEVLEDCPTQYGRRNNLRTPAQMIARYKDLTVSVEAADKLPIEDIRGKLLVGVLHHVERSEFAERYDKIIEEARGASS
ncbi:MAG: 2-oxoacid:ferredoxin oxidoreductase subunit beta [Candidatus Alcyoniella australis]|nr:2-oxoacid:ferredoxin oxidoreductase subunit beta [Candidatus Alcyoniella australis]